MSPLQPAVRSQPAYRMKSLAAQPLKLTNDGDLTLFFLGVGGAFSKRHFQNNLLIVQGQDHLLVDCGNRAPQAFHEAGLPLSNVSRFYITHSHADHIGGLEEAMLLGRYMNRTRPQVWITEAYQNQLWEQSLKGGNAFNEESGGRYLDFGDYFEVHRPRWVPGAPRETYAFEVGSLTFEAFRTMHFPSSAPSWERSAWSTGLVINERVLFTGDTRFDPDLLDEVTGRHDIQTIFHDCQFTPPGGVHASLDELETLPLALRSKMVLMHYGDDWERHEARVAAAGFAGLVQQWTSYEFGRKTSGRR